MNFIKTSDEKTAEKLRNLNYQELAREGEFFVFINNADKIVFSDDDTKKLVFTNKLYL